MPLRSQLFAASKALQSCLVSDAAHVVPGAQGDHVALIQSALVRLRFLDIADAQVEARKYGPKTTAAVLDYKKVHKVINPRYQTQADSIVGKMTIDSLDNAIFVLDGGADQIPRGVAPPGPHPVSPTSPPTPGRAPPAGIRPGVRVFGVTGPRGFRGSLASLPQDMQDTIRRSNEAKVPNKRMLLPFIFDSEGPLSDSDLSARFDLPAHAGFRNMLVEVHTRMRPFDIWRNVRIIIDVFFGTGNSSRGIKCEPVDHNAFLAQMKALTTGPRISPNSSGVPVVKFPVTDSKFCQDSFNVHGARDSFREIVKQGPGLHICIAQPAVRSTLDCDLHIDAIQQGQVCSNGFCIPLINGQTIQHLNTVGPWLAKKATGKAD